VRIGRLGVVEHGGETYIIDVSLCRIHILTETMLRHGDSTTLARPCSLSLERKETTGLISIREALAGLGVGVEEFGGSTFVISTAPDCVHPDHIGSMIRHVLKLDSRKLSDRSSLAEAIAEYVVQSETAEPALADLISQWLSLDLPVDARPVFLLCDDDLARVFP